MAAAFNKIFVIYPRGVRTGGPEALHQLVSTLRGLGQDAFLVPRPGTETAERVEAYSRYDAPEVTSIEDTVGNAVVTSEYVMNYLGRVKHATRFCWWLSIDNSPVFRDARKALGLWESEKERRIQQTKFRSLAQIRSVRSAFRGESLLLRNVNHLTQSQYAWSYLYSRLDILSTMVSDFTPLATVQSVDKVPSSERGTTIAYNPKKAARITELLKEELPEAEYVPLTGMSSLEVAETLASSAIYLDLGYHPGKDRMPREAAMCGAVSLVARRGSGAFHADVPIPWEHKVSPNGNILNNAKEAIQRVFSEPEAHWAMQSAYRSQIEHEQETFVREVEAAFVKGQLESGGQ